MCLDVKNAEKMLRARTIDGAFRRHKNIFLSEVGIAEKKLKARMQHCAFWRYLNCFEKQGEQMVHSDAI